MNKKTMFKKSIYGVGTLAILVSPIATVISCGSNSNDKTKEETKSKGASEPTNGGNKEVTATGKNPNVGKYQVFKEQDSNVSDANKFTYSPLWGTPANEYKYNDYERDANGDIVNKADGTPNIIQKAPAFGGKKGVMNLADTNIQAWVNRMKQAHPSNLLDKFNSEELAFIKSEVQKELPTSDLSDDEFNTLVNIFGKFTDKENQFTQGILADPKVMANEGELVNKNSSPESMRFNLKVSEKDNFWRASLLTKDMVKSAFANEKFSEVKAPKDQKLAFVQQCLSTGNLRFVLGGKDAQGNVVIYPLIIKDQKASKIDIFEFWRFNDINTGDVRHNLDTIIGMTENGEKSYFTWGFNVTPGLMFNSDEDTDKNGKFDEKIDQAPFVWTNLIGNVLKVSDYFFGFKDVQNSVGPNLAPSDGWTRAWTYAYNLDMDASKFAGLIQNPDGTPKTGYVLATNFSSAGANNAMDVIFENQNRWTEIV